MANTLELMNRGERVGMGEEGYATGVERGGDKGFFIQGCALRDL